MDNNNKAMERDDNKAVSAMFLLKTGRLSNLLISIGLSVIQKKRAYINKTVMMNHVIRYRAIAWLNSSMFPPNDSMTPDPGIKIVA